LRVREIIVERITVVKFGVNGRVYRVKGVVAHRGQRQIYDCLVRNTTVSMNSRVHFVVVL